ncbi:glucosyltransferase domain-containing protein [Adlercreutzia sp. ZJ154]|uniref:glucosyltransferase domain-containing protein n=1 Tax=Adlercreutzia sp. ZJ154 TaxID=2709790 RepID=UPI0013E9F055|nr:glucosyltransferase domain-containing protein [Adlercreutzia sp. ZJ154]
MSQWETKKKAFLEIYRSSFAIVAVSTVIFACLGHLYRWMSPYFSHDSLMIDQAVDIAHNIAIGRFLIPLYIYLRGEITAPFLIGVISTLFLVFSNFLIVKLLGIKDRVCIVLLCGLLTVNATIILVNATYINFLDSMILALFLAVAGVYVCKRFRLGFLGATLLFAASMGLYQSYMQVAACLTLLVSLRMAIEGDSLRSVSAFILKALVAAVVGCLFYYAGTRVAISITGIAESAAYNSVGSLASLSDVNILSELQKWYMQPINYLLFPETHAAKLVGFCDLLLIVMFVLGAIWLVRPHRKNSLDRFIAALLILILLPLSVSVFNLTMDGGQHGLMIYAFFLIYPAFVMVLELLICRVKGSVYPTKISFLSDKSLTWIGIVKVVSIIVLAGICVSNIIYANQVYLKKDLEGQATLSVMTRVASDMESVEGYIHGETPVIIVGNLTENPAFTGARKGFPPEGLPFNEQLYATGLGRKVSTTYIKTYAYYFDFVLGCPIKLATDDSIVSPIKQSDAVKNMPAFPSDKCCQMIDGVLVVKLS